MDSRLWISKIPRSEGRENHGLQALGIYLLSTDWFLGQATLPAAIGRHARHMPRKPLKNTDF